MKSTRAFIATILPFLLAVFAGSALVGGPALSCGATVDADVRFSQTLQCSGGSGLTVSAGVTVDLNGHSLIGSAGTTGIHILTPESVTIKNGAIRGWGTGIRADGARNGDRFSVTVDYVALAGNGLGVFGWSADLAITSSTFRGNAVGVAGRLLSARIDESAFLDNGRGAGIEYGGGVAVTNSSFTRNRLAVSCSESYFTVIYSEFTDNSQAGESFDCNQVVFRSSRFSGNGSVYSSNLHDYGVDEFTGNRFVGNGDVIMSGVSTEIRNNVFVDNRIAVQALLPQGFTTTMILERNVFVRNTDAIYVTMPSVVKRNIVVGNTGYGIYAPNARDLGGNVALANGMGPQCTGVGCRPLGNR